MRDYRPFIAIGVLLLIIILVPLLMVKGMAVPKDDYAAFSGNVSKQLSLLSQVDNGLRTTTDNISASIIALKANTELGMIDKQQKLDAINLQLSGLSTTIANHTSLLDSLTAQLNNKANTVDFDEFRKALNQESYITQSMQSAVVNMQAIVNSLTSEIRGNGIQGKAKLLGSPDYNVTASSPANILVLARFQATSTGTLNLMRIRATTYGGIKVAVYSDNASKPGILLTSSTYDTIVADGYPTVSVGAISVTAGQFYWLAYDSATACVGWSTGATGNILYSKTAVAYATLVFPDIINIANFSADTRSCLISGWTY